MYLSNRRIITNNSKRIIGIKRVQKRVKIYSSTGLVDVMSKAGKHYRFRKLEFWAESGMINMIDERYPESHPGSFKVIMVRDWLERLQTLNKEIHRWNKYPDERNEMSNFIDNGIASAKEAKAQGRPDDPKAAAEILRSRRQKYFIGTGQQATLHTASADTAPEGLLLPPITATEKKLIIP